jgi:basic membrane protein A and related proteins
VLKTRRAAVGLIVLAMIAVACSSNDNAGGGGTPSGSAAEKVSVALILPNVKNDFTWNQQAYEGAVKVQESGLIDLQVSDNVGQDAASFLAVAERYAQSGVQLIVGHTFDYGQPILTSLASKYPDVDFVWSGSGVAEDTTTNVGDYAQPFHEGSYLAGILMAGASTTGKIGGIAGFDIPACHAMMEGFRAGAKLVNPNIEMVITYLGTWYDPAKEKEAAFAQYDQGADVIGICGTPTGVIEAAKERNLGVVGYVHDQSSASTTNVLTSVVWNFDVVLGAMATDVANGTFRPGKVYNLGVKDGGISVPVNSAFHNPVTQAAMDVYNSTLAGMQDGSITAPYIPEGTG